MTMVGDGGRETLKVRVRRLPLYICVPNHVNFRFQPLGASPALRSGDHTQNCTAPIGFTQHASKLIGVLIALKAECVTRRNAAELDRRNAESVSEPQHKRRRVESEDGDYSIDQQDNVDWVERQDGVCRGLRLLCRISWCVKLSTC